MKLYLGLILVVAAIFFFFLLRRRKSAASPSAKSKSEKSLKDSNIAHHEDALSDIKNKFEVMSIKKDFVANLHSEGQQILFKLDEKFRNCSMEINLKLTNQSTGELIIEKVVWELWFGSLIKTGHHAERIQIPAKNVKNDFILTATLSEAEARAVADSQLLNPQCYLEGMLWCKVPSGAFQKKFAECSTRYKVTGHVLPKPLMIDLHTHLDSVTGLLQRKFLEDHLQTIIDTTVYRGAVSCIMMDIDSFKHINDEFGHLVGDDVLKAVCVQIKKAVGEKGLAVRYGGDEFCIVLDRCESADALGLAEKIRMSVEAYEFKMDSGELKITVSLGVATLRQAAEFKMLLKKADDMLLQSKKHGKNRVTVDPS